MTHINNQIAQGLKNKHSGFMRAKEILLLATINQLTMKNLLTIIFSLFFFTNSFAQRKKVIDSLVNELNKTDSLSYKIFLYDELAWQLKDNEPDRAIKFAEDGLKISLG